MKPWQIRLLALLSFAALVLITISYCAPHIENDLRSKTIKQLRAAELDFAEVEVDGRELSISGLAPTESMKQEAENIARGVFGTNSVQSSIAIADPISPYTLTLDFDGTHASIEGWVGDQETRHMIEKRAADTFGAGNVSTQLRMGGGQPTGWSNAVGFMMEHLTSLTHGQVNFVDKTIRINGRGGDTKSARQYENDIAGYQDSGYEIIAHVSAPAPPPPPLPTCQETFDTLLAGESIRFTSSASKIKADSYDLLDRLVAVAEECSQANIVITGHTDDVGSEEANQRLSLNRAQSVVDYLVSKTIARHRLKALGMGETQPIANNENAEGRALNRRIEFTVEGV